MPDLPSHTIGWVSSQLGMSIDTLRYYEKIGLLPPVRRTASGQRRYSSPDLSRLRFIRRAQGMGFSLEEIAQLTVNLCQGSDSSWTINSPCTA